MVPVRPAAASRTCASVTPDMSHSPTTSPDASSVEVSVPSTISAT